ncbi:enoyl-CoA hydratase/isomerase family protein [Xanthobacter dioxanivorans]|uniref:Enoyl-CoA hydratase/isomerase family protein n=1 Tax=Xanthobacter dioxanivorans TaxID=2528964 RepID=A0A974PJY3_9HYPH|nr:enoyl-CoA hydratase-related protein [Xanthobacter dioxanivorans]QRG04743.1 enoyl-CoA hydratase/isomerase family protein [Xanthobacter dioxanivorans]
MTAATDETPILLDIADGIARIRFNRPQVLNAIHEGAVVALKAAVDKVAKDESVRVVVLSGEGRAFLAGGDVARFHEAGRDAPKVVNAIIDPFHHAILSLSAMSAPVIASLHGAVAGAGVSVALAADLAIAADDMKMTLAYTRIGTSPDGSSTFSLPRVVGLRKAMEIALLSDTIDAPEALRLGLVNKVVPAADLAAETDALARRLAAGPTLAYGRIKHLLRSSFSHSLSDQLHAERDAFVASAGTRDFHEGAAAFVEKRAPRFEGN